MLQGGYTCVAAHCNFHLRGKESDRDAAFVQTLCTKLQVPLHIHDFDTKSYAEAHRVSVEMAARELRYAWFEEVREQERAQVIGVAHHRDDSVETFFCEFGAWYRHSRIERDCAEEWGNRPSFIGCRQDGHFGFLGVYEGRIMSWTAPIRETSLPVISSV